MTAAFPATIWPPGCGQNGCKHHYPAGRNLASEGCVCPCWSDGGGWHLIASNAACTSPAHRSRHLVFPLDAHEAEWRCRTCGTVFTNTSGWATCPHDPDPPQPPALAGTRPGAGSRPTPLGENLDDILDRLLAWAEGHAGYPAAADLLTLDVRLRAGDPYPSRWEDRRIDDVPFPAEDR